MVVTADDVSDLHQRVVNRDHVVINRDAGRNTSCRSDQDRIADGISRKLHIAAYNVMKAQRRLGNSEAYGKDFAGLSARSAGGRVNQATAARVDLRAMLFDRQGALGFELFRGAEAAISFATG